ncbi:MAG: hypothetical protein WD877_01620 [Candidatus Saccharimonadales bacterium]
MTPEAPGEDRYFTNIRTGFPPTSEIYRDDRTEVFLAELRQAENEASDPKMLRRGILERRSLPRLKQSRVKLLGKMIMGQSLVERHLEAARITQTVLDERVRRAKLLVELFKEKPKATSS